MTKSCLVWITQRARRAIIEEANLWPGKETGGALVGYRTDDEFVVTWMIGPGPGARHGHTTFCPDQAFQEQAIGDHYQASGRVETYLGDWHTHPAGTGRLSRLDRRTLASVAHHPEARTTKPLMAVVYPSHPWRFAVWVGCRRFAGIVNLHAESTKVIFVQENSLP